jgi:hypothetical protein
MGGLGRSSVADMIDYRSYKIETPGGLSALLSWSNARILKPWLERREDFVAIKPSKFGMARDALQLFRLIADRRRRGGVTAQ